MRSAFFSAAVALLALATLSACSAPTDEKDEPWSEESPAPHVVEPVIVVAEVDPSGSAVTVSGYVQGIIEEGGVCTFTLEGPGAPVRVTTEAVPDAAYTSCGQVEVPTSDLAPGSWSAVLSYVIDTGTVSSRPSTLEIQ